MDSVGPAKAAADLLDRAHYADALRLVRAVDPDDAGYPAARLVEMRVLLEQGRIGELPRLFDQTPAATYRRAGDGRVLGLWRDYTRALTRPAEIPDVLDRLAEAKRGPEERCRIEAIALQARVTRLRVLYAELPMAASQDAADGFARAADGYRRLGLLPEAWAATRLRCHAVRAAHPHAPEAPVLRLLDEIAAEARAAGHPVTEAGARLAALEIRTLAVLRGPEPWSLDDTAAEVTAVGALLDGAGHAFGSHLAEWTVIAVLLQHGVADVVGPARDCARAFAKQGAPQLAHAVWRALDQFHGYRGDGAAQREASRSAARVVVEGDWQMFDLVEAIGSAEAEFRGGRIGRARAVVDAQLAAAPHRQARVSLRLMLSSQLVALNRPEVAAGLLRDAVADLTPVAPGTLSGEVLAQLATVELATDPAAASARAADAVDAARRIGDLPAAGRYLTIRAQLRVQARFAAARRPFLDAEAEADLAAAEAMLAPVLTTEARKALVGVHQMRGQGAFFDGDTDGWVSAFQAGERVARAASLGPDLAFLLSHAGMAATQHARDHHHVAGFDNAAELLDEAHDLFLRAEMGQVAWRALFLAANARWEASRLDPDPTAAGDRLRQAEDGLERAAAELDTLRGAAGGDGPLERQSTGIAFGVDKQQVYRTGFHLAVAGRQDTTQAVLWLERMKSRALVDVLAPSGALGWSGARDVLIADHDRSGRRILVAQYFRDGPVTLLFGMAADWSRPRMCTVDVDAAALEAFARGTFRTSGGVRMAMQDSPDGGLAAWHGFSALVAPLTDWAGPEDVVYLVPHQDLHDLPLHTLPVGDGTPLGQRNPVCYSPSLAVLTHTLTRPHRPASTGQVAVFGDPRGNLRWARREAQAVADALGAGQPVVGAGVTRDAVVAALRAARTVHVAGHARASVADGLDAGIELAGTDVLRTRDLLGVTVGADLVALSGCETGVSHHRPGDEAVGLPRALIHGGARALLTSQWRVNDRSAQRLLTAFHTSDADLSRADALRQAMRTSAADPGREHFYHWGAFVLVGDWR
ncbi:CHAT domain-containing protein [Asanoa sp. WMMD1127]|uniref:CHAT domain-containing protein n=1 Tax=Asanoa sp. WMMD1127 TaxID=3016107 RepID=UPI0024164626|nr:CHAT domain-containing protein [Asanoa sp. WMMD1127]MDG4823965.1 CHAT domain-containing protein [Asanoa sp. WMMD1127]